MIAVLLAKQIAQMFLMMFCGWMLVRLGLLKASDSKSLSVLVVYVICPCTILNAFQISFTPETASNFMLAAGSAAVIHLLLYIITSVLKRTMGLSVIEQASIMYSNAGNLVIPLVTAVLGSEWVIYASAFMVVQMFILWTHGKSVIEGKRSADLKAVFTNMNLLACVTGLGMFLAHVQLPEVLGSTVRTLGGTVGPVSMLMLGIILGGAEIGTLIRGRRIWIIIFLKMIVTPLLILLIMKYSGIAKLSPEGVTVLYISLLAVMTPSATTVTQLAQLYGREVSYATAINTVTTLICIATMPLLTMIYYL